MHQNMSHRTGKMSALVLALSLAVQTVLPQQREISGTIRAGDTGESLPGASVVVSGTTRGAVSDLDGNYRIMVGPQDDTLVFSYVGYMLEKVRIADRSVINVVLKLQAIGLDEIVVIGYGTVRKSDLTGSVSSVKAADLVKITSVNPEQALQGKVAGVHVTSLSGAPGAGTSVRIRGVGTFNNSSPIFVVDGIILDDISFLNTSDISSMEVLKDASATAIYGSRGANGVILVTTKRGEAGLAKPLFSFSSEVGLQKLARKIDLLDGKEFAIISNEIRAGSYNNVDAVPNTDWQDLIFHTGLMQKHEFSMSGSTALTRFYLGVGVHSEDGIIDKSSYDRISLKLNNTYSLSKNIELGNNITLAPYRQQNEPGVTFAVYRAQPLLEPYYDDGSFGVVHNVGNPLASLEYSNNFRKGIRGVGNLFGTVTFLESLIFRSSFGVDASYNKAESFTPAYTVYNPDGTASQQQNVLSDIYKGSTENLSWLWENTLTFDRQFGNHSINVLGGYTLQKISSQEFRLSGENLIRDGEDFWYITPAYIIDEANNVNTLQNIYNGVDPNLYYSMMSYLFRTNYTYNGKYIVTATFRRDGSSKFSKENRYSNFPAFALGWNLGREEFIRNIPFITTMKLRGSWGMIGNEKISYFDRYARVQSDIIATFGSPDNSYPAASYGKSGNPDLKWETTTQTDIGLEIGVMDNRLTGEFDFYNRVTDDILVELSTPGHIGNGLGQRVRYNAASVLNRGIEVMVNWRETMGDLSYSAGVVGSTVYNEVLDIGGVGVDSTLIGGYLANGQAVTLSKEGLPIGAFYGYQTDGIFQDQQELDDYPHDSQAEAGDLRFVDVYDDDRINGQDRTYIGSPIPKFIFGFYGEVEYRGFDLSVDFQGQTGNKIFNGKEVVRPDPYNFEQHVMDRWTGPGTSNTEPRPSFGGYNYRPSDRFIQDGSYLRLRNLSLGYTLPASLTDRLFMQQLRVYIKGTNLYTLTKFTGYTPEIGSSDVLSNGIDKGIYPVTAIYSIGLNLIF